MPRKDNGTDHVIRVSEETYKSTTELVFDLRAEGGRKEVLSLLVEYAISPQGKYSISEFLNRKTIRP